MRPADLNNSLRSLVAKLIDLGWLRTTIGKILLGTNGQAHMNRWLNEDSLKQNDFGVKPLQTIASLLHHHIEIVFVSDEDAELSKYIETRNQEVIQELEKGILAYLTNSIEAPKITRTGRSRIDSLLDEMTGVVNESGSPFEPPVSS